MPLTDTEVRNARPQGTKKRLFDGGGLYLEIAPGGGKWRWFKYCHSGKERRLLLGMYPDVPLKKARQRRDEMRALLADGIDSSENSKAVHAAGADSAAKTFKVVAREWFAKFAPIDLGYQYFLKWPNP